MARSGGGRVAPGPLPPGRRRDEVLGAVTDALSAVPAGTVVVVACSGGPDSTALAFLTAEARPDLRPVLVHVAHGLRDEQTDRDLVVGHAAWLGVPARLEDVEVVRAGRGTEAAARVARYAALRRVAAEVGAAAVLVGHTADDQAETVLLRLARGTGIDGLAAMDVVADDVVRPLLRLRRVDVHAFVAGDGLPTATDPTNDDPGLRRNVVRHEVLPALGRVAPDPVAALVRLADLARDDRELLHTATAELRSQVRYVGEVAAVPVATLAAAPVAAARRVVRSLLAPPGTPAPDAAVVERVVGAARVGDGSAGGSLPGGVEVTVAGGWCAIAPVAVASPPTLEVAVPGVTVWSPAAVGVRAAVPGDDAQRGADGVSQLGFDLAGAWSPPRARIAPAVVPPGAHAQRLVLLLPAGCGPLELRAWRAGDRVATAAGTRTVADVFTDAGLPRPARSRWPLVTAADRVVWVPGFAADAEMVRAGRAAPAVQLVVVPAGTTSPRATAIPRPTSRSARSTSPAPPTSDPGH